MPHKKKTSSDGLSEQEALVKRVDRMMDPSQPDLPEPLESQPADDKPAASSSDQPPLDIFAGIKTAPELPGEHVKVVTKKSAGSARPSEKLAAESEPSSPQVAAEPPEKIEPPAEAVASQESVVSAPLLPASLDDQATDKAVDDIVAADSDALLSVPIHHKAARPVVGHMPAKKAPRHAHSARWLWIVLFIILLIVFAWLLTHYQLFGWHLY